MTVYEIVQAVVRLSPEELAAFQTWFADFDAGLWDRQCEDEAAGRLDQFADEALQDLNEGCCTDL